MITALNINNKKVLAFKTLKEEGPFFCSECNEEVVLKKGEVKLHHFAHKSSSTCLHSGESFLHESIKYELYEKLNTSSFYSEVEIEKTIGSSRADVFAIKNGQSIAFEIQASSLTREKLKERTKKYSDKSIHTLWIIPYEKISSKDWIKYVSFMYFGFLYVWKDGKLFYFKKGVLKEVSLDRLFLIKRKRYKDVMEAYICLHFEMKEKKSLLEKSFSFFFSVFKNLAQRA